VNDHVLVSINILFSTEHIVEEEFANSIDIVLHQRILESQPLVTNKGMLFCVEILISYIITTAIFLMIYNSPCIKFQQSRS
jgi:hypothetical protein